MLNWLVFTTFIASMTMTLFGLIVDLTYQVKIQPALLKEQQLLSQQLPDFLQEKLHFQQHRVFNPSLEKGENFALLYGRLSAGNESKRIIDIEGKKSILLLGDRWLEQKHKVEMPESIASLFEKIESYSYWRPQQLLDSGVATDLIVSGQLFLAHTFFFQPQAVREALAKTRHLSLILLSMPDWNFKRAGLSLLEKENVFMEHLKTRIHKGQLIWTPVANNELRRFRKFMQKTYLYLNFLTAPAQVEQVFLQDKLPVGFCAVYRKRQSFLTGLRPYLEQQFPYEPNFQENLARIKAVETLSRKHCHNHRDDISESNRHWSLNFPYLRRVYGAQLMLQGQKIGETL